MTPFTQYTQAATCVCYERGYVIDGQGDFAACSCEAGAKWAVSRTAKAAPAVEFVTAETPGLAPAIASFTRTVKTAPVVTVRPARRSAEARAFESEMRANAGAKVVSRASAMFADLALAVQGRNLTFRRGTQSESYFIRPNGVIVLIESPRFEAFYPAQRRHINATLNAYAVRLAKGGRPNA